MVVIAYLALAGLYATSIPPGKGPDETAHVRYVSWLADNHRLPVFQREHPGADYEFHQPPLFYLVSLPTYLLAGGGGDVALQAVRFVSILFGIALLYLTFGLGRVLAPDRPWVAVAAAGVVAFLPMHLALVASVGNDVLTEVFFAAALLLMVHYLRGASSYRRGEAERPPGVSAMASLGLMIGLGMLTKSLAVLLFPVGWAAAALAARGPKGYEWRRLARDAAVSTAVALALCGWWLVRNQIIYGDPLAQKAFLSAFQDRPSPQSFMAQYEVTPPLYVVQVAIITLASSLGMFGPPFGNRFAFFPYWVYLIFWVKALGEGGGFLRYLPRAGLADWQRQAWWLSGLLGLLLVVSFVRFNLSFFQAQARYLFPALPPAALALCLGLNELAPSRWRPAALAAGVGLVALLAFVGLFLWIVPQFHLTPPALPASP